MLSLKHFSQTIFNALQMQLVNIPEEFSGLGRAFIHGSSIYAHSTDNSLKVAAKDIDIFFGQSAAQVLDNNQGLTVFVEEHGINTTIAILSDHKILVEINTSRGRSHVIYFDYASSFKTEMIDRLNNAPHAQAKYVTDNDTIRSVEIMIMPNDKTVDVVEADLVASNGKLLYVKNDRIHDYDVLMFRHFSLSRYTEEISKSYYISTLLIDQPINPNMLPEDRMLDPEHRYSFLGFCILTTDIDYDLNEIVDRTVQSLKERYESRDVQFNQGETTDGNQ